MLVDELLPGDGVFHPPQIEEPVAHLGDQGEAEAEQERMGGDTVQTSGDQ